MTGYPYVVVQAKLKSFLGEIKRLGIPEAANSSWLRTIGYTSSNDLSIPKVMEFIGFVDVSRKPTDKWRDFRDENASGKILAGAIREGYSALYQIHPDAHKRSVDELANFFRSHTEAGDNAVRRTANTFKTLCSLADFSTIQDVEVVPGDADAPPPAQEQPPQPNIDSQTITPATPAHNIDIQITISSDSSVAQIKQIFESMAQHLYNRDVQAAELQRDSPEEE